MKTVLAALALFALAACSDRGRETGRVGESADTTLQTRTTQDTTIVTSDTTVNMDTTRKEGDVKRDTAKQ
jgi:outer membrane biogenesis lipoprotein LolB